LAGFLGGWALLGWLPTLMPAVAWQPYYALLGALGAWLGIAAALARSPVVAIAAVAALSILRSGYADTPSNAWSNAWSQRAGAAFVGVTRGYFTGRFPSLPPHARLFFTGVPGGGALVSGSGDSPPLRVWYSDSTIQGALYSQFQARPPSQPPGPDLFFRFDAATGWVEVTRGAEDVALARRANPRWERDHDKLAATLARGGDWAGAAGEYSKLAAANPGESDFAFNAGLCHETLGDRLLAAEWYRRAAALPGADADILEAARRTSSARP